LFTDFNGGNVVYLPLQLEEGEDFLTFLNPKSRWEVAAVGDSNLRNLKKGEIIQLERKGYFICDVPYFRSSKPIVLITIPDGRQRPAPGGAPLK
jgi:glutamyl-tRNA synthetase